MSGAARRTQLALPASSFRYPGGMRRRIWNPPAIITALVVLLGARYIATFLVWVTAAEYWYPPVQNAKDAAVTLATWMFWIAFFYLIGCVFVLVIRLGLGRVAGPQGLTKWLEGWTSWKGQYEYLKDGFAPLIANAKGIPLGDAEQMISDMFPVPEGEKFFTLTRDPDAREALRAWRHLTGPTIFGRWNLYGWDKDSRGWNAKRRLRARLWKETLDVLDAAHPDKNRWIIEISPQYGMVNNTIQAIDLYLTQHGYAHLVTGPLKSWSEDSVAGAAVLHRTDAEWWEYESGRNIVVVLYTDKKPQKQADDEISALTLVLSAAPLARIPLATSSKQLEGAKTQVEHMAELLALRGFTPPEFRDRPEFNGIVDAKALAQWAIREVVLDTEPERIMEVR